MQGKDSTSDTTNTKRTGKSAGRQWQPGAEAISGKANRWSENRRKLASLLLLAALVTPGQAGGLAPAGTVYAATAATPAPTVKQVSEEPITAGALLRTYEWTSMRSNNQVKANARAIVVDLANPNVKLDVMTGANGQFTEKQTVRGMAASTGAVAGVNGDFYNTQADGAPEGPEVAGGKLMSSAPFLPSYYAFAVSKNNTPIIDLFTFGGKVTAADGATFDIAGVNKAPYWFVPSGQHSHVDAIHLYTDAWGSTVHAVDRATDLLEVLVQNGVVVQKKEGSLDMIAPKDGYILRTEGKGADFIRQHVKVGDKIKAEYSQSALDPAAQYDVANFKMMIGGQPLLVDQGQAAQLPASAADLGGYRSRTAVGYTKDQRYVYIITVDRSASSAGMSLQELQQFMESLGLWKGMNLDGGGSTQMVSRPLGETGVKLVGETENNSERRVVNGLGVFSTAPKGQVKGIQVAGQTVLLMNERASFAIKAYDEYYNPVDATQQTWQWSVSNPIGHFEGDKFVTERTGKATITAASGSARGSMEVEVIGRSEIASLQIQPSSSVLMGNTDVTLNVKVKTKSGVERVLPGSLFAWEISGFQGKITDGVLHVDSLNGTDRGSLIAAYDGLHAMTTLPVGESKVWADFDNANMAASFTGTAGVQGQVKRVPVTAAGSTTVNNAVYLGYDMTKGTTGTKAAYMAFGDGTGITLADEPQTMSMKVDGDNSLNWLRAEFIDADGDSNLVEFTKSINWTGWKTMTADLTSYHMTYPIKLKRIYVANPEQGQDERALTGSIRFDDISFLYRKAISPATRNKVKLTIGSKTIAVNGANQTIEMAPVIVNDNTLVPFRFVVQALGGTVEWDDKERKVTARQGDRLGELWIGQTGININGTLVTAEVAPQIMNDFTMVPLRVLTEGFGWKVTWDEKTRTVALE